MIQAKDLCEEEYLYGHKACSGCGLGIVGRLAMKVLGRRTVVALPASCMSTVTTQYPQMSYCVPSLTMAFAGTGAVLSGLSAGFKVQGIEKVNIVGIAGDGGTADIGLQALSGAVEQGYDMIYICYDNEAYMNTGNQRSGLTPVGAATKTTPVGTASYGEKHRKKNMFEIMVAHGIPYAATASISYPNDYVKKLENAKNIKGPAFIHIMSPCPTGWGYSTEMSIEIGKMAVKCGLWYLAEYKDGKVTLNMVPKKFEPVKEYLLSQKRFRHLDDKQIQAIEQTRDMEWGKINKCWL